jgi:hypothetical protein
MGTPKKKNVAKAKGKLRDLSSKKNPKGGYKLENRIGGGRNLLNPQPLPP